MAHASKAPHYLSGEPTDHYGFRAFAKNPTYWDIVPFQFAHRAHFSKYHKLRRLALCNILLGLDFGVHVGLDRRSKTLTLKYLSPPGTGPRGPVTAYTRLPHGAGAHLRDGFFQVHGR